MKLCTTNPVQNIGLDECVGTSLVKINSNFNALNEGICFNTDRVNVLSASYQSFLATTQNLLAGSDQIAWDAIRITPTSYDNFNASNIINIIKLPGAGRYQIAGSFGSTNYLVFGTATSFTQPPSSFFVTTSNYTNNSVDINIRNINYELVDCDYVTISIYN